MKNNYIYVVMLFIFATFSAIATPGKTSLSGKITDKESGQPIPGVTIYIPDLKTGAVTGMDGTYKIDNLPQTN